LDQIIRLAKSNHLDPKVAQRYFDEYQEIKARQLKRLPELNKQGEAVLRAMEAAAKPKTEGEHGENSNGN
jgi:hypothetical protein